MFNKGGNSVKIQAQIESLVLESAKWNYIFHIWDHCDGTVEKYMVEISPCPVIPLNPWFFVHAPPSLELSQRPYLVPQGRSKG